MQKSDRAKTDQLIHASRTMLWLALIVVALLGAIALAINLFPESGWGNRLQQLLQILPIFIVAGIFSIRKKGLKLDPNDSAMKAVLEDELRVASAHRAYRYGFIGVLFAQPTLALLLQLIQQNNVWLMCSMSLTLGFSVFIATTLILDR
ncbi:hypothetical protein [Undibacterium aquatile]|uniref:DUF2178 domain-containing protein n=1 Tax=Undibacterium aquatile TaxID=1537398 RepID=A0ABR6XJ83_9BURK|nr:hypothetical protein [Undibacterium aquatile]MBC3812847.1 hypothetical protein [Undibacterium aquatile]